MENNKPAHEIRIGVVKATIWRQEAEDKAWYTVTLQRLYRLEGNWHSTASLRRDDLLLARKVLDRAHTWITGQPADGQEN